MGVSIHIDSNGETEVVPLVGKNEIVDLWMPIIHRKGLELIEQCVSGGLQVDEGLYDGLLWETSVLLQELEAFNSPTAYSLSPVARCRRLLEILTQHPPASGDQVYIG